MRMQVDFVPVSHLTAMSPQFRLAEAFAMTAESSPNEHLFEAQLGSLQIFAPSDNWPFLHCGGDSTTAEIIGRDAARDLIGHVGLGASEFHAAVTSDFNWVAETGRPIAQHVQGELTIDGQPLLVSYYRYVFRLQFGAGGALGCMTRFSEPFQSSGTPPQA